MDFKLCSLTFLLAFALNAFLHTTFQKINFVLIPIHYVAISDVGYIEQAWTRQRRKIKMAMNRPGKSAIVLSSAPLQLILYLTGVYYVFYFLSTLGMLIYKSCVLSYPGDNLTLEVCLLFLMAGLEILRLYSGMRGNLQEREGYVGINMVLTVPAVMLSVYFLLWQTYVLRADVIVNALLLSMYGLGGLLAFITLARFTSSYT